MNKNVSSGIALAIGFVVCVGGWILVPTLQSGKDAVASDASLKLERARRLLHQYDPALAYKSMIVDRFAADGMEVDADNLSEDVEADFEAIHGSIWDAYTPREARKPDYGNIAGQVRQGLDEQAQLAADNERLLTDALRAVNEALNVSVGGEDARSHAEANRLKAVIQYHQGLARWSQAQLLRQEADGYRRELAALAINAAGAAANRNLVADTGIDEELAKLEGRIGETEAAVSVDREALGTLEVRIGDLEARLAAAKGRLDEARKAIDSVRARGVDFSDANGSENFRRDMEDLDWQFRKEMREVHALQHGNYPNATIDASRDFLKGRYVEHGKTDDLTIAFGLDHYRNERTILAAAVQRRTQELDDLRADLARMQEAKERYRAAEVAAAARIAETRETAAEVFADLDRADAEAFTVEDEALQLLDESARTAKQASRYAELWISEARDRQDRSSAYAKRVNDTWIGAHIAAQEADARLVAAWVDYDRYEACTENANLFTSAGPIGLKEADPEAETAKAAEARTAAVDQITQAMEVLQNAHRKLNNHWTLTAQAAGANDLMSLFGYEDYLTDAIESYRNAVKGRENDKVARPFAERLTKLEGR